jgi:hypothetical protein
MSAKVGATSATVGAPLRKDYGEAAAAHLSAVAAYAGALDAF